MKFKSFVSLVASGLVVISFSSCGIASVNTQSEGNAITHAQLDKIPIGTTQEQILAQFGEPNRTT